MCNTDWEWGDPLEAPIEVINEGCNEMNVVSFDLPSGELLGLHGDLGMIQGNLLMGIDKKNVRREGISIFLLMFSSR